MSDNIYKQMHIAIYGERPIKFEKRPLLKVDEEILLADIRDNPGEYVNFLGAIPKLTDSEINMVVEADTKQETTSNIAKHKLVLHNIPYIHTCVNNYYKKYNNNNLTRGDITALAITGALKAAERYYAPGYDDKGNKIKFVTYAHYWIKQSIISGINECYTIHIPRNRIDQLRKINKAREKLDHELMCESSLEKAVEEAGVKWDMEGEECILGAGNIIYLDNPLSDSFDSSTLGSLIEDTTIPAPSHLIDQQAIQNEVEFYLSVLTERERSIIEWRFGLGCKKEKLKEIGKKQDVSKECIRQIEDRAIKKMRRAGCITRRLEAINFNLG